jgi:hypothetical protein
MSTELKKVKGRIQHKHGTEAHWFTAGTAENPFIPLPGELIIYDPDAIYEQKRTKYGDGVTPVHLLPWASGCNESVGLEYTLSEDGIYYSVTGAGACKDIDILIPKKYNGLPVTNIGDSAFKDCTSFTSVIIPDSVTNIGNSAFSGCSSLTSIEIPNSVTSIGAGAFYNCSLLTSIEIPASVASIGSLAVAACSLLTIYCEKTSEPSGWDYLWNFSNRPVFWGFASDFVAVNGKINALNEKVGEGADTSNLATVDKIHYIDTRYGGSVTSISPEDDGIYYNIDGQIQGAQYKNMADIEFKGNIPIAAGDNVTFEVDEENQVVKINSSTVNIVADSTTTLQDVVDALLESNKDI